MAEKPKKPKKFTVRVGGFSYIDFVAFVRWRGRIYQLKDTNRLLADYIGRTVQVETSTDKLTDHPKVTAVTASTE